MHNFKKHCFAATLSLLFAGSTLAATGIESVTVTPAQGARVGEPVTITIQFVSPESGICGIEVEPGEGRRETIRIKENTPLPVVVQHTYKTPGEHKIRVDGTRVENALGCSGKEIVMYKVAPAAAPLAKAKAAGTTNCPEGWASKAKPAKSGAFTCTPAKGVKNPAKPETPLKCPMGTSYFVTNKSLGCEAN